MRFTAAQHTFMDTLVEDFWELDQHSRSALSLGEQLYSARGSQSVAAGTYIANKADARVGDKDSFLMMQFYHKGEQANR